MITPEKLAKFEALVTKALKAARRNQKEIGDAVNWGDLRVVDVLHSPKTGALTAMIHEASPDANVFQHWIWDWVYEHGFRHGERGGDFEIRSEW